MVGKDEKSSGLCIHRETIRISTEKAIEKASPMSIMKVGMGRKRMHRIRMMPKAKPISRPLGATLGMDNAGGCAMVHPSLHRSEEHTSELQSLMRISYAVFCLTKKKKNN